MDTQYIEILLEKFWNAETTEQEEQQLKIFFQQPNIDPVLAYAKPFFVVMEDDQSGAPDLTESIVSRLVEKYYAAETNLDEEAILKSYFTQDNVAPALQAHSAIFRSFNMMGNVVYSKPLKIQKADSKKVSIIHLNWFKVAAAAVFFGVGGYFVLQQSTQTEMPTIAKARYIEPDNPEEALEYTLKALAMVSRKYKKGEAQLLEGMKTINNAKGAGN